MTPRYRHSGTVAAATVLLVVLALIILAIARYFWVDSANRYFNGLIAVYTDEKTEYSPQDHDSLRSRLIEPGMFIKIHRWNRDSFIKDQALYKDMIAARDQRQMRREKSEGSVIDTVINL